MSKLSGLSSPRTPNRSLNNSNSFSPREKSTPSRDLPGPAKTSFGHLSTFNSFIQQWHRLHSKGLTICKAIQALKLHEIIGEEYPTQLTALCESLVEANDGMENVIEGMKTVSKPLNALGLLCKSSDPLINTWSAAKISIEIDKIITMYEEEMKLKKIVTENIAHCRDECVTEVYVSSWEYPIYIDKTELSLFSIEMGFIPESQQD